MLYMHTCVVELWFVMPLHMLHTKWRLSSKALCMHVHRQYQAKHSSLSFITSFLYSLQAQ